MTKPKKIKLIVEVDEKIVCKGFEQPLTEEERNILIRAIGNGTSYNPSGDLISREALKANMKKAEEQADTFEMLVEFYEQIIDNASPVEAYPFEQMQELVKLNQQFVQKIENLKRPQGEWIIVKDEKWGDNVKCPFCGKELAGTDLNFCCKCGAELTGSEKMNGGKEE